MWMLSWNLSERTEWSKLMWSTLWTSMKLWNSWWSSMNLWKLRNCRWTSMNLWSWSYLSVYLKRKKTLNQPVEASHPSVCWLSRETCCHHSLADHRNSPRNISLSKPQPQHMYAIAPRRGSRLCHLVSLLHSYQHADRSRCAPSPSLPLVGSKPSHQGHHLAGHCRLVQAGHNCLIPSKTDPHLLTPHMCGSQRWPPSALDDPAQLPARRRPYQLSLRLQRLLRSCHPDPAALVSSLPSTSSCHS
mmetsp:Transcript_65591/g.156803  ORF Transcript_65591/g.156803 Transcript_65591/m.156803 type:complete len:245 (-) Transcript_65591:786-1520(-)